MLRTDMSESVSKERARMKRMTESNVEGDLLSPDEVLDGELHTRAQEAHGHHEGLGGKERRGQGALGELLDGADKEKDGATHGRDGHIEDRPREVPDEVSDDSTQVDEEEVWDGLDNTDDEPSNGSTQVDEEAVHDTEDEERSLENMWEPATTLLVAVKPMISTEADLVLDAIKDSPGETLQNGRGGEDALPTEIEIPPVDLEKISPVPDQTPESPDKILDRGSECEEPRAKKCGNTQQDGKRKPSSWKEGPYERAKKFIERVGSFGNLSDRSYSSGLCSFVNHIEDWTMSSLERAFQGQDKKDGQRSSEDDSTATVDSWHGSTDSDDSSEKPSASGGERTGTPILGGYWKDKTAGPSDLTSTLELPSQTKEDLWAKRREWLKKCSGFSSKREQEEISKILFGQVIGWASVWYCHG
ncbi:hypothetical protein ABVK25_007516 [Lepraria finkii]|uniref:Uncharacterized protein n=1 Tax=Lepraria finkii TaxID=1340010 RepID=A0ABR4B2J3_9LECA